MSDINKGLSVLVESLASRYHLIFSPCRKCCALYCMYIFCNNICRVCLWDEYNNLGELEGAFDIVIMADWYVTFENYTM